MSDKVFLDTNILVYAHTDLNAQKQSAAQKLIIDSSTVISTQVVQELANTLHRKFKHSWRDISKVLTESVHNSVLHVNDNKTLLLACRLAYRYHFSYFDSLILAAAIECRCSVLLSEDLQDGQIIEKKLKILNPFI